MPGSTLGSGWINRARRDEGGERMTKRQIVELVAGVAGTTKQAVSSGTTVTKRAQACKA